MSHILTKTSCFWQICVGTSSPARYLFWYYNAAASSSQQQRCNREDRKYLWQFYTRKNRKKNPGIKRNFEKVIPSLFWISFLLSRDILLFKIHDSSLVVSLHSCFSLLLLFLFGKLVYITLIRFEWLVD